MSDPASDLLSLLDVKRLDDNLYRGAGTGGETTVRVFGGLVIAQALAAAYRTVDERPCHSLHAYFMRPGKPDKMLDYVVDRMRDGRSFTTRHVTAQQDGEDIFTLIASFHVVEEGYTHQHPMPDVPGPDGIMTREELRAANAHRVDEKRRSDYLRPRAIQIREVEPQDHFEPEPMSDVNHLWFRLPAAEGQDPAMQQCLMAYASDMNLLGSCLRPHGLTWFKRKVMTASLDHAMWFHAPVQFDQWHLFSMDSPQSGGGRGFNRGRIYSQDGRLVANVAQEGLMRPLTR